LTAVQASPLHTRQGTIWRSTFLLQGSPNNFSRGPHKLLLNCSRAGHLTSCDCFGICYSTFYL